MIKLMRELMVIAMLGIVSAGAFAQRRDQDKRPPKEPVKVITNDRKDNRPPPQKQQSAAKAGQTGTGPNEARKLESQKAPRFDVAPFPCYISLSSTAAMPRPEPSRVLVILAFAAVYLIWGSTYLAIRFAIETLPPFLMAATRFLIAGAILFAWARFKWREPSFIIPQWAKRFIIGGLLLLCGNGGVTWAEKYVASGLAALLVASEPLWVVILNWGLTHKRPNAKVLLGVLIGL